MNSTTVLIILAIVFPLALFVVIYLKKWRNQYKFSFVFGKKGAGKTTLLVKLAMKYGKKGWKIYCTDRIPGTYYLPPKEIGYCKLDPHSVLLIDEVSLLFSNRDFRNWDKNVEVFFRLQRHLKVRVYAFSQSFDVDKKLRDLTDQMYLISNVLGVFSYGKRINKKTVLTLAESDRPSTIAENLQFDSFLLFWAGSRFFTFIPKYAKYFNSFVAPELPEVDFEYTPFPDPAPSKFKLMSERVHTFFKRIRKRCIRHHNKRSNK